MVPQAPGLVGCDWKLALGALARHEHLDFVQCQEDSLLEHESHLAATFLGLPAHGQFQWVHSETSCRGIEHRHVLVEHSGWIPLAMCG